MKGVLDIPYRSKLITFQPASSKINIFNISKAENCINFYIQLLTLGPPATAQKIGELRHPT